MKKGFSLVELSIVLVILGLLTGGILTGQSLIRAAEMRSVTTEYSRYVTAVQTFRDKYFALPGDMSKATLFWGDDNAACADAATSNGSPGTCNGNGDGRIGTSATPNMTSEAYQFWKQLALAGLVEGTYSGLNGSTLADAVIGTNVPPSKLSNGGWSVFTWDNAPGDTTNFKADYGNHLVFGAYLAGFSTAGNILTTEEAWNIDKKLDDGLPGQGKAIAINWDFCTEATTFADVTAKYDLDNPGIKCAFRFRHSF